MTVTLTGFILKEVLLLQEKSNCKQKQLNLKSKMKRCILFFVNSLISEEENYEVLSIVQYHEETPFEAQIYSHCKLIYIYTFF